MAGLSVGSSLANAIFETSKAFPKEEKYSLTDQIRRSSRSVCANLGESYLRRHYPQHFKAKLIDCGSENDETQVWLDFALDCQYIDCMTYEKLTTQAITTGKLLTYMLRNPEKY
ncbi:MAG: four helix bundle protein [Bacteroidota bacterium]